jgi:hypothetical protein
MKPGLTLIIAKRIILLLEQQSILLPDGSFDDTKLDTIEEDVTFAAGIEQILKDAGLDVPDRVDKIVKALPLLLSIIR